jgi:hypothetical protein
MKIVPFLVRYELHELSFNSSLRIQSVMIQREGTAKGAAAAAEYRIGGTKPGVGGVQAAD